MAETTASHFKASVLQLAPYASQHSSSQGRRRAEASSSHRSDFQRDRDRVLHAGAFRKLQYKTQVFVAHEGDNFRTRLTHSLEVAQIARAIANTLGLDQDLTEAIALAHDLGHTPFGHAGEDALSESLKARGAPDFDHNDQTLRIVTHLEQSYASFDGLNLTWETVEGIAKHNGPVIGSVPETIQALDKSWGLDLTGYASAEAQVAALADDIAYNNHDIDDGVRVGLLSLDAFEQLPFVGPVIAEVRKTFPQANTEQTRHEVLRRTIDGMVRDVITASRERLANLPDQSLDAVRSADAPVIAFSFEMQAALKVLRAHLFEHVYRHFEVNRMRVKAKRIVSDLFDYFWDHPDCLPTQLYLALRDLDEPGKLRLITDYIAGMTDLHATNEHRALFSTSVMQSFGHKF